MALAQVCVVLAICWTLLFVPWTLMAYLSNPSPLHSSLFFWLTDQWLREGVMVLASVGALSVMGAQRTQSPVRRLPWWNAWWIWMVWAGLGMIVSIDQGITLRVCLSLLSYGLLAYTVSNVIRSSRDALQWARLLGGVAVAVSVQGAWQYAGGFHDSGALFAELQQSGALKLGQGWFGSVISDFFARRRITALFGWPNLFAGFLVLMIPLVIGLAQSASTRLGRLGWWTATVYFVSCLAATLSMSGWMAVLITAALAWWLVGGRTRRQSLQVIGVGLGICALIWIVALQLNPARSFILGSLKSRLVYLQGAAHMVKAHPVTGTGLGTFALAYDALRLPQNREGQHRTAHAHNTLAELAAELGLVGTVLFLLVLLGVWRQVSWVIRTPEHHPLACGVAFGVVGFVLHSFIEDTFFEAMLAPLWWVMLGLLTGLVSLESRSARPPSRLAHRWVPAGAACLVLITSVRLIIADLSVAQGDRAGNLLDGLKQDR